MSEREELVRRSIELKNLCGNVWYLHGLHREGFGFRFKHITNTLLTITQGFLDFPDLVDSGKVENSLDYLDRYVNGALENNKSRRRELYSRISEGKNAGNFVLDEHFSPDDGQVKPYIDRRYPKTKG